MYLRLPSLPGQLQRVVGVVSSGLVVVTAIVVAVALANLIVDRVAIVHGDVELKCALPAVRAGVLASLQLICPSILVVSIMCHNRYLFYCLP